ncbi:MAG: type II toxin-antitoxin system VapC family toxin [Leptospirales bacterium]|nr:type II toxin-antitoxin system VapC family toxin [Leptospirales bacterium]
MVYLDTSVVLAALLAEDRRPPVELWSEELISSRLLEYELWNRLHARKLERSHGDAALAILSSVALLELSPTVLSRAINPFPFAVRTLDALHLASMLFLMAHNQEVQLACYDERLSRCAQAMGIADYFPGT